MSKSVIKELEELNKEKGGIFEVFFHRRISVHITSLLIHTNISPNIVTMFSTLLAVIAAIFFLKADYTSLIIGSIFLSFSFTFDCVDGELARYKKIGSKFGAWLDSLCDRLSEYSVFTGLTLGLYFKTGNPTVLIMGLFALANAMMISSIRSLNRLYFDTKPNHEVRFGMRYYIGRADFIITLVIISALLNKVYYFLMFFAVFGTLVWVRQIYRRVAKDRTK